MPAIENPMTGEAAPDREAHWQQVYGKKSETEVSWFEARPDLSLALMEEAGYGADRLAAAVIDIGGGASRLVDALLARGQHAVTVLDLSAAALALARQRLAAQAQLSAVLDRVSWVAADVTRWQPDRPYDLWHDRAAFHFLTTPEDQRAYVVALTAALVVGGVAIIGTFAPNGPARCSCLPVARHDADSLALVLGPGFDGIATRRHDHMTPGGAVQHFQFTTFRKLA